MIDGASVGLPKLSMILRIWFAVANLLQGTNLGRATGYSFADIFADG